MSDTPTPRAVPCKVCGQAVPFPLSFGGPDICPQCDVGGPLNADERAELGRLRRAALAASAGPLGAWDEGNIGRWLAEECHCGECEDSGNIADMCPRRSVRALLTAYAALRATVAEYDSIRDEIRFCADSTHPDAGRDDE